MNKSRIWRALEKRSAGDGAIRKLLDLVEECHHTSVDRLKLVPLYMRQYTLHDQVHVDRVIDLMDRLIPPKTFKNLKPLELASLILAASLHDIGMAASKHEVDEFRRMRKPSEGRSPYQSFREAYPGVLRRIEQLQRLKDHQQIIDLEDYLTSEFLRREHAERSADEIFKRRDEFSYDGANFAKQIAEVCASHTKPSEELDKLPCWELVRSGGERCNWRWVALLLRLADILDFDAKRTPKVLFEHLGVRDKISLKEWGKHMAVNAWDIAPGRIAFNVKCPDPVIEKTVRTFVDLIDRELIEAPSVLGRMHHPDNPELVEDYTLDLPRRVDRAEIGPASDASGPLYRYVDLEFTLDRDRIISLVLGIQLYADRSLFLRELLQNAVDACRMRVAQEAEKGAGAAYVPSVSVALQMRGSAPHIEVEDNGVGMDEAIVQRYFARIGRSYYVSPEFLETRAARNLRFKPISQFGIGVLSVFMAGDHLTVESKRWDSHADPLALEVTDSGALFWFKRGKREPAGTRVCLRLEHPTEKVFGSASPKSGKSDKDQEFQRLVGAVEATAAHVEFPITVRYAGLEKRVETSWQDFSKRHERFCSSIDIDLTSTAPPGLNGRARVFVLTDPGTKLFTASYEDKPTWDDDEDVDRSHYSHQSGAIQHAETRTYRSGETSTGYSAHVATHGRWSQQGIAVNSDVFPTYDRFWMTPRPSASVLAPFPFPMHYDLDLSEEFVLPLSADRKSILPSDEARTTALKIACEIARALLLAVGKRGAQANAAVLRKILSLSSEGHLVSVFDDFIGPTRPPTKK